jgi:hypothetical protein
MHIHRPEEHIVLEQDLKIEFRDVRLEENKLTVLLESLTKWCWFTYTSQLRTLYGSITADAGSMLTLSNT